jgi:hypothetical protein
MWLLFAAVVSSVASAPIAAQVRADAPPPYAPPRTPDGKPDLQGIWQALNTAAWDIQDHSARLGVPAGQGVVEGNEIPYQPWAAARKKDNFEKTPNRGSGRKVLSAGRARITYMPHPFQIFQTPGTTAILYEYDPRRANDLYGSTAPSRPHRFLARHVARRWEGDTLVVDVIDFNDKTWFDAAGNFHSDALHVVERYTRTGPDHIAYEVTIDDPKVFTRPVEDEHDPLPAPGTERPTARL